MERSRAQRGVREGEDQRKVRNHFSCLIFSCLVIVSGTGLRRASVVVTAPRAAGSDRWAAEALQVFATPPRRHIMKPSGQRCGYILHSFSYSNQIFVGAIVEFLKLKGVGECLDGGSVCR